MTRGEIKVEAPELRLDPDRILESVDWLEVIGIGKGRFLLAVAEARPEVLHLGVEWANKYLRIAEHRAVRRGLKNIRFARVDGRELVCCAIPDRSVAVYYVFYPDPWPKKRHHKRRFFREDTVEHLARTLREDGLIHVATDHSEYWAVIDSLLDGHAAFERLEQFGGPRFPLDADGPLTNFEEKYGVQGRVRFRGSWIRRNR